MSTNDYLKKTVVISDGQHDRLVLNGIDGQHFFPHTIIDYAKCLDKSIVSNSYNLPIMAIDSHDCYECDYQCIGCLASETKQWCKDNLHLFDNYSEDFKRYKVALEKIAIYSKGFGITNVRLEMSGEGNPDLYPFRKEIILYAASLGMNPVYISSGSFIDDELLRVIVMKCGYIRISMPGLDNNSYQKYSQQTRFKFDDAIKLIKKIVLMRKQANREDEMIIGVRYCLRPEFIGKMLPICRLFLTLGVNTIQIVQAISNEYAAANTATPDEMEQELKEIARYKECRVPYNSAYYYNKRENTTLQTCNKCFASELTPILCGPFLIPCTHTDIIRDPQQYHTQLTKDSDLYLGQHRTKAGVTKKYLV